LPSEEDIERVVTERVTALLEQKLRTLDKLVQERMHRMMPLAQALNASEDERRILAMLLDEYYHAALHSPSVLPEVDAGRAPGAAPVSSPRPAGGSSGTSAGEGSRAPRRGRRGGRSRRG
jgi:ATP-dependent RNA helicase DeaD